MPLSAKEIDNLIQKIRAKYNNHAKEYNSTWFDINKFEERYQMALKNRMSLEAFVLAEITNFEKIKEKYDSKKNQESFSDKVDQIIEDQLAAIKKYSKIDFHPNADLEIKYLYGVLHELALFYFPIFWITIRDYSLRGLIQPLEEELSDLSLANGPHPPRAIEDYTLLISRPGASELEMEKSKNNYLKKAAFSLHNILDYSNELLSIRDESLEMPIQFGHTYINEKNKKQIQELFGNSTGYGAILKIKELCENILNDFRIFAFRQK